MKKNKLSASITAIAVPLAYLLAALLISLFGLKTGLGKLGEQSKILSAAKKTQSTLQQKESLLRQRETQISSEIDILANVIPEKNPALTMITQLKNLAITNSIILTSFKIGSQNDSGAVSFVDLNFDAEGAVSSLINFLSSLKNLAPLSAIDKAKLNQLGGIGAVNVSIRVYFAPYPTKLPSLTEAINDLTDEEKDLLDTLSGLTLPTFTTLTPQEPSIRENPFN
jgi:Tfp pilus assembly protein PilO